MTLIISTISKHCATVTADMRLSSGGRTTTEFSGKVGFIRSNDAVALYAYTGLASLRTFEVKKWIQDAFLDAKADDFVETVYRFGEIATAKFQNLAYRGHGITLSLAGFHASGQHFLGTVSNLEDESGLFLEIPDKTFRVRVFQSSGDDTTIVSVNGVNQNEFLTNLRPLNDLVTRNVPPRAIQNCAAGTIRSLSRDSRTHGTVGSNIISSALYFDGSTQEPKAEGIFLPFQRAAAIFSPDLLDLSAGVAINNVQISVAGKQIDPNLPRNARCWCGSGKKFKRCHG